MLTAVAFELLMILVLILANGFFAASEIAVVSARRSRLEPQARAGSSAARQALNLAENPDRFLATVQVGMSLISTFAAAFGGARLGGIIATSLADVPALAPYAATLGLWIVVLGLTYFTLVLGELTPKRLALQHAERMAMIAAPLMRWLSWIARPLVAVLSVSVSLLLRLLNQHRPREEAVSEEDIVFMLKEGQQHGSIEQGEAQLIHRVLRFTDRPVRAVMTPHTEVAGLPASASLRQAIELFQQTKYSRLPVYQQSLDHIVGVLYAKDLVGLNDPDDQLLIMPLIRPATFVLEYQHVDDVLTMFRRQGVHMALVVDEYGQTSGLITLEDILEELVGEIWDEHDQREEHPFVQREDGSWLVDAMAAYDTVQERLGLPASPLEEQRSYTSLAGLILTRLGRIPDVGDTVAVGDFTLEVVDMDGRRIDKVLISRRAAPPTADIQDQPGPGQLE